jgi:predicted DNA-binding transcriptional regulator YafY
VKTLTELILEAAITPELFQQQIDKKQRISIYYKGDKENPKGWYRIEPVSISTDKGVQYGYGFKIIDKEKGTLESYRSRFKLEDITNWNVLSSKTTTYKKDDPIEEAIVNKRVVSMYYKGDKEEAPGFRTGIEPVCYGERNGVQYLRAWQKGGKSVSADKDGGKKQLPSWRFFRVDRIRQWKVTGNETFTSPPAANFNPNGDKHMDKIIAIADFKADEQEPPSDLGPKLPTTGTKPTTKAKPPSTKEPKKKPLKGPARPGAIDEGLMIDSILDAVRIF